ncbi:MULTISPECIES: VOC family protein [Pseudofrankia]|uniref:VOC family protein n=1 Tax=Pseudofrankia TaxID=2994363 RepID=UPI000234B913|nr:MULTISPECIES: VOC family protein [Pseudofrankia]OHV29809.1 glyoxalase [Pseudofrankia sp. EUN1h]
MTAGLPTSRGIEHLNITVADLDEVTAFFTDVFGCQTLYTMGPFEGRRGPFMRVIANADVRSVVHYVRVLRSPFLNIELFQVSTPRQRTVWPDLLDVGGWGLTAAVDDIDAAVDFLAERDVYALGERRYLTPFGLHFELVRAPAESTPIAEPAWRPRPGSLPGFRGFERLRVTVAELDEASAFLADILGFRRDVDLPPWPPGGPDGGLRAFANVDARARPTRARALRSSHLSIELIECPPYPGQQQGWPAMFDVGGWHLAIYVDDIDAAFDSLTTRDAHILGRKKPAYDYEAGDEAYTIHGLAPFGLYFELVTYPRGRYREADHAGPPWHPALATDR